VETQTTRMAKAERTELGALVRKREKVLKTAANERAATMLAQFEEQMAAHYSYDSDATWKAAYEEAEKIVEAAKEQVARRNQELGIPKAFAPNLILNWYGQGAQAVREERARLRTLAKAQIDRRTAEAKTKIERLSLEAQTEIVANGLQSEAAQAFLKRMPPIEQLMPALEIQELKKLASGKNE